MLSQEEFLRYKRQIQLPEIGEAGQAKLNNAKVLMVGAGGLGCPILRYLTAAGIGTIGIVDFDKVDVSNLQRQILYDADDVGKFKVDCAIDKLSRQNPNVQFVSCKLQLTNQNAIDIIKNYDVVIDGTDNFATRYLLNDACVLLDKPWVYGSVHRFEGQVSVFNYLNDHKIKGPTYRCLFPTPSILDVNCSDIGVLGILPGIVGMFQANETIKIITGIGDVLSGELLLFNALNMQFNSINFERNETAIQAVPISDVQFKQTDYGQICISDEKESNYEMSSNELFSLLSKERNSIQLIDIREDYELPQIIELQEINIPLAELMDKVENIDRNKKVIVYCESGLRSAMAIKLLQKKFEMDNVFALKGGINEWLKIVKK